MRRISCVLVFIIISTLGCSSGPKLINSYTVDDWESSTILEKLKAATPLNKIDDIRNVIEHFELPEYSFPKNLECTSALYTLLVQHDGKILGFWGDKALDSLTESYISQALLSTKFKPIGYSDKSSTLYSIKVAFTFYQGKMSSTLSASSKKKVNEEYDKKKGVEVPYDSPPTPIGGFSAIQKKLKYPELARKAGIEGKVMLQLLILDSAKLGPYKVLESPLDLFTEAAYKAVSEVKWKPATRDGSPCTVWVAVPIIFRFRK